MKRELFLLLSAAAVIVILGAGVQAWNGIERRTQIGPSNATASVTIAAAGTGRRNCLTELDVLSNAVYDLNVVLQSGTTIYSVSLSSGSGLVRSWDDQNALCGAANAPIYINVSAGTNIDINYQGYTY